MPASLGDANISRIAGCTSTQRTGLPIATIEPMRLSGCSTAWANMIVPPSEAPIVSTREAPVRDRATTARSAAPRSVTARSSRPYASPPPTDRDAPCCRRSTRKTSKPAWARYPSSEKPLGW